MVVLALSTVAFRMISITRKEGNAPAKKKRVHFAPTISTVHTIWQSKQEVWDNRATYARVSILRYFSEECQRIVPADAPFVRPRGKQGGPELAVEPAAGKIQKRVHFSPTISTVHRIYQSNQEVRDKRASYAHVSTLRYFSECQRIVPADEPFVRPRGKQGGPELVVEPAAGKIQKRVHFSPTISTVHRIYQSNQEVRDKRASYARVSTLIYFSQCQRIVPADEPFVRPRGKQGDPELVEEPAVGGILLILPREVQVDELIHD